MFTFNARSEFAALAESAGTTIEQLLKKAADKAVEEGEAATKDIAKDEAVINDAKLRIQRGQATLKKASNVLRLVKKYVS